MPDLAPIQQNGWSKYVRAYEYRSAQSSELGLIPNQPVVPSPVQGFLALPLRLGHGLQLVLRRPGADDFVALTQPRRLARVGGRHRVPPPGIVRAHPTDHRAI